MGANELSALLWRERELLEMLLFKLEEEQLLLAAGRSRWLGNATREVEMVLEEIRRAELTRAIEVGTVAGELDLPDGASLRDLAEHAPVPWGDILRQHRTAFLTLSQELAGLAQANRELLAAGYRAARDALDSMGTREVRTYSPTGQSVSRATGPSLLNEVG